MIFFTIKHWVFARRASAFQKFGLDVEWEKEVIFIGIVTRWVVGRSEEWKNRFDTPEKFAQRVRSRKRRDVSLNPFQNLLSFDRSTETGNSCLYTVKPLSMNT
jgi:hypothetical protein